MATTLGKANALRYRSYVYDPETGLYYLQSRYYNPGTGRFINADILVSTGQGLLGNNMFAYCLNNPVRRKDIGGAVSADIFDNELDHTDDDKEFGHGNTSNGGSNGNGNSTPGGQVNGSAGSGTKTDPFKGGSYSSGQYYKNNPGSNPQYSAPKGGGGITSSTSVNQFRVSFYHGGRHIDPSQFNYYDIEQVIAHDVMNHPMSLYSTNNVVITYDGWSIIYKYTLFGLFDIGIGTYYFINFLQ